MLLSVRYCSLILFRDKPFDKALDNGEIIISTPVLLELAEVLARDKLNKYLTEQERMRFLVALLKNPRWSG